MLQKYSKVTPAISLIDIPRAYFFHNLITKDVHQMCYPFHLMLTSLFSAKFNLRNSFITPNGRTYYIVMLFMVLLVTVSYSCRIYFNYTYEMVPYGELQTLTTVVFYIYYCVCFNTLYIFSITKSQTNILLILKIQLIHKSIYNNKSMKKNVICNWILCLIIVFCNIVIYTCLFIFKPSYTLWDLVFDALFISFDVNLIYAIRIIMLLTDYVNEWKRNVELMNTGEENVTYCKKMVKVYETILEAFELYKKVSELLVR